MPVWGMEVEALAQGEKIPTDAIAFFHAGHRHVRKLVAVDRPTEIRGAETGPKEQIEIAFGIDGGEVDLVKLLGLGREPLDVVVNEPALVLVVFDEEADEFSVGVLRRSVRACHPLTRDDDRSDQTGIDVPSLVDVRVIELHDRKI